ncbi:uncharacterized protein SAPINGB_P000617 [Magnusiomyces paraingens]|uniref:F-box domain-containing protein n=1 Tax=Magnusiomyces paraingens TaxID=2606893 RepID=A0A5E8B1U3_9ASCO|nr:uncharacterized protein SAPINGB_P000617 [Saprochaete ingens]VVT45039.1 unnamed protein product [Saprochaete ingens]
MLNISFFELLPTEIHEQLANYLSCHDRQALSQCSTVLQVQYRRLAWRFCEVVLESNLRATSYIAFTRQPSPRENKRVLIPAALLWAPERYSWFPSNSVHDVRFWFQSELDPDGTEYVYEKLLEQDVFRIHRKYPIVFWWLAKVSFSASISPVQGFLDSPFYCDLERRLTQQTDLHPFELDIMFKISKLVTPFTFIHRIKYSHSITKLEFDRNMNIDEPIAVEFPNLEVAKISHFIDSRNFKDIMQKISHSKKLRDLRIHMSWDILSHWKDAINDGLLQIVPDIETCVLKISETSLPSDYDSELKSFLVPQVTSFVTSTHDLLSGHCIFPRATSMTIELHSNLSAFRFTPLSTSLQSLNVHICEFTLSLAYFIKAIPQLQSLKQLKVNQQETRIFMYNYDIQNYCTRVVQKFHAKTFVCELELVDLQRKLNLESFNWKIRQVLGVDFDILSSKILDPVASFIHCTEVSNSLQTEIFETFRYECGVAIQMMFYDALFSVLPDLRALEYFKLERSEVCFYSSLALTNFLLHHRPPQLKQALLHFVDTDPTFCDKDGVLRSIYDESLPIIDDGVFSVCPFFGILPNNTNYVRAGTPPGPFVGSSNSNGSVSSTSRNGSTSSSSARSSSSTKRTSDVSTTTRISSASTTTALTASITNESPGKPSHSPNHPPTPPAPGASNRSGWRYHLQGAATPATVDERYRGSCKKSHVFLYDFCYAKDQPLTDEDMQSIVRNEGSWVTGQFGGWI